MTPALLSLTPKLSYPLHTLSFLPSTYGRVRDITAIGAQGLLLQLYPGVGLLLQLHPGYKIQHFCIAAAFIIG